MAGTEAFEAYFRRADLNQDGRISGQEAVAFFQGANLPQQVLAQVPSLNPSFDSRIRTLVRPILGVIAVNHRSLAPRIRMS
jgi:hypothetical protein